MSSVFFSIITPIFNRAWCIESRVIKSILKQSYYDWELIIIDDGSDDNIADIISKYKSDQRIIYHKIKSRCGANIARNIGIDLSRGEWLIFLDSDDELSDYALEIIFTELDKIKNTNIACVKFNAYDEFGNIIAYMPFKEMIISGEDVLFWRFIAKRYHLNWELLTCIKASALKSQNLRFPASSYLESVLQLKIFMLYPVKYINIPLARFYRMNKDRLSLRKDLSKFKEIAENLKEVNKLINMYDIKSGIANKFKDKVLFDVCRQIVISNLLSKNVTNAKEQIKTMFKSGKYGFLPVIMSVCCFIPSIIYKWLYIGYTKLFCGRSKG